MAQGGMGVMVNNDRIEEEHEVFTATSGAIDVSIAPGKPFQFLGFELAINTAPTTAENLVVTKNSGVGATYDVILYSLDLSVDSTIDIVNYFDVPIKCYHKDDTIDITYTNTDARTYALTIFYRLLKG